MNFYKSAALALDHLDIHRGSVKSSLSAARASSEAESKRILALVIETLKYKAVLEQLLLAVPILKLEKLTFPRRSPTGSPTNTNLVYVLLHDLLFSPKRRIEASEQWPPKQALLRHQTRLRAELVRIQIKSGKSSIKDLAKSAQNTVFARYIRWNPNIDAHREDDWSLAALHRHLKTLNFTFLESPVHPPPADTYFFDEHVPSLLVFPSTTSWWINDPWYKSGAIVLQDKASCFPAIVVMDGWAGEGCIDATAAPGNKTSLMSAIMNGKGKLYAYEKSTQRFKTLNAMLERAECHRHVTTFNQDFLEVDPETFPDVERILLDPSCSGSGIVNRLDYLVEEAPSEDDRLDKLASFQLQIILHAMKFPNVHRIVYSTCSIHPEEDEHVVMKALQSTHNWRLAPRSSVLPTWERRGRIDEMNGDKDLADCVVRCLPEDNTNGFFVSCFERIKGSKRSHDRDDMESGPKAKTLAQLERNRRKKKQQKQQKQQRQHEPEP